LITRQTEKEFIMAKMTTKCCPTSSTCEKTTDFKFYAPKAKKVELGGDFNNWKANKTPLTKDAAGNWKTSLKLKSGRYQYRYLVDGIWQNAQEPVECVPNTFGSWNCVIEVAK
jgi:1,4-alpha-glucan branching enzyme